MQKTDKSTALVLFASPELKATKQELVLLQQSAIAQFARMSAIRKEETVRGLLLGMTLHRLKASLPYGEFGAWMKSQVKGYSERWSRYLMRLAMVFAVKGRLTKPMMLALPGEQTELALDTMEGAQRAFMEKALRFCGDYSLSELLDKHGIKETGKLGGAREALPRGETTPPTPEQLYLLARDEIGAVLNEAERLLVAENRLQHLAGHPEEIRGVVASLQKLTSTLERAARPLLSKAVSDKR